MTKKFNFEDKRTRKLLYEKSKQVLSGTEDPYIVFSVLDDLLIHYILKIPADYRPGVYAHLSCVSNRVKAVEQHETTIGSAND